MKDIKLKDKIAQGINDLFYIWKREFQTTFRDQGVLIFFILVPLGYPLLYSFIYDNEVVREVPAVVVDDSHSSLSREYLRKVDATPDIQIVSYCADMALSISLPILVTISPKENRRKSAFTAT